MKNDTVELCGKFGRKVGIAMPKSVDATASKKNFLHETFFIKATKTLNLSSRVATKLGALVKEDSGAKRLPFNITTKLHEAKHVMDELFEVQTISFLCNDEDGDKFERQDVDIASPPSPPRRSRARPTQLQETQCYCVVAKDISQLQSVLDLREKSVSGILSLKSRISLISSFSLSNQFIVYNER